jgi:2-dehydro-3-deoxyphosphogluconate aldolase/(4S)-4-hydroxy-2-oxoglutarate aldolase
MTADTPMPPAPDVTELSALIGDRAIVAVVEIDDPIRAGELARVLADSGVDALEVTFRRPNALDALARAAEPQALPVGAGTILSTVAADAAVAAGAGFLISPGLDEQLVAYGRRLGVPTVPGVLTPSDVQAAVRIGCSEVKLFPAERFGGLQLLSSLSAVFTGVRFMPTGGVDHDRAVEYLRHERVFAVGGTWIAPPDLIARGDWVEIANRATTIRIERDRFR